MVSSAGLRCSCQHLPKASQSSRDPYPCVALVTAEMHCDLVILQLLNDAQSHGLAL